MNGTMAPLLPSSYVDLTLKRIYADFEGKVSLEECMQLLETMQREELWMNDEYQVAVDKSPTHGFAGMTIWHVSIKRRDKEPVHDWRDLQAIKNQLCGPEAEAIELYPAESRKVDSANQYHLFAFIKDNRRKRNPRIPVGWDTRYVHDEPFINGKQRPLNEGETKDSALPRR